MTDGDGESEPRNAPPTSNGRSGCPEGTDDRGTGTTTPSERSSENDDGPGDDWRIAFGHRTPYPEQEDGIETVIETARDSGFVALEGACGTGKTMLALTAGVHLVRDRKTDFERVLVLTSVKQQLRQFEADLRSINADLPTDCPSVTGLTLVGKADVCPYALERTAGIDDETVYERCDGLRERTRNLVGEEGPTTAAGLVEEARRAQTGLVNSGRSGVNYLEAAGEPTPYLPETPEHEGTADGGTEFCPFYANFLDDLPAEGDPAEAIPFEIEGRGLIDTGELVRLAAGHGSCPHSVMGALLSEVEIVIGNYYHAFDPVTVATFTGPLLDESTLVVCDEAHMLEPRVRELVSDGVAERTLRDAESELSRVLQPLEFDAGERERTHGTDPDLVRSELAETGLSPADLERTRALIRDLREELDRRVTAHLDRTRTDWQSSLDELEDEEIPLRDPEEPAVDAITDWARRAGYAEDDWLRAESVGAVVERILNSASESDAQRAVPGVGRTLAAWARLDHETFFRELRLDRTWDTTEPSNSWRRAYNLRLALHNCVPAGPIGDRLGEFGGGLLMSATLAPLTVFREVTGLDRVANDDRPVVERTYGLSFPADNRVSFAVDAPKFTYQNREAPGSENECRRAYVTATSTVARTAPGNVLVGMPNYREAEWMAGVLREQVDKPVLLDESSTHETTEDLKTAFFEGDGKILVTSLRGTLTEGVDYRGDRLAAAVVCGVPMINTAAPRTKAVKTAYDRRFSDGFETALTVPAVRKARQAVGRVIRGPEEIGARVLVDARYARDSWNSVRRHFPPGEREEFQPVSLDMLQFGLEQFWSGEVRE